MIADEVIADLDAFVPVDETENVGRLYEILDPLKSLAPQLRVPVIAAILRLIERHPDAELGAPGPLVHELEALPGYEPFLSDSVARQPAGLNIWMVNRILNEVRSATIRSNWLDLLHTVLEHPLASEESKAFAAESLRLHR